MCCLQKASTHMQHWPLRGLLMAFRPTRLHASSQILASPDTTCCLALLLMVLHTLTILSSEDVDSPVKPRRRHGYISCIRLRLFDVALANRQHRRLPEHRACALRRRYVGTAIMFSPGYAQCRCPAHTPEMGTPRTSMILLRRPWTISKPLSLLQTTAASRRSLRAPLSALSSSRMTSEASNSRTGRGASLFAPRVFSAPACRGSYFLSHLVS